jgi:hypothetical protein
MENTQDHEAITIDPVLKNISRILRMQHKLAELRASFKGPPDLRMIGDDLAGFNQREPDRPGVLRIPIMEKCGEPFEISERGRRPLQPHRSRHGR